MYAIALLHRTLDKRCSEIHAARLNACYLAVQSLVEGAKATVTSLGRGLSGTAYDKHKIKRMDRLLSNQALHLELITLYSALANTLLKGMLEPVILIDWSPLCADQSSQLLRAAIPVGGRSLTLYEEVHPRSKLGNRRIQHQFLHQLAALIPSHCRPIVVADSGFRTPFYRYVEKTLQWHWVGRIRSRDFISFSTAAGQWFSAKSLYTNATIKAQCLGQIDWVRRNPLASRLIVIRQSRKKRQDLTYSGVARRSKQTRSHAGREREPWLLVYSVSLKDRTPKQLVSLYRSRMQIEESFRDHKAAHYGLAISQHRNMAENRRAILCLLATLAHFVLWCVGTAGKRTDKARHVRVNSSSKRAPYSVIFLAKLLINQKQFRLPDKEVIASLHKIKVHAKLAVCC
ncbi:MAG: IS4 family transposase [Rhodospirillaceae bacterium]|nr:IS4 family transposase [Rhodospirillaceae bacterium]